MDMKISSLHARCVEVNNLCKWGYSSTFGRTSYCNSEDSCRYKRLER